MAPLPYQILLPLARREIWFVTGSQHLYGEEALRKVAAHAQEIAATLANAPAVPVRVVFQPVLTDSEQILALCQAASNAFDCIGVVVWMHTFSPAKMWIAGLKVLSKPLLHLHTQFNRDIPWASLDMDFMNLNQAAHGDREFGFMAARLRLARKVVVGHWADPEVQERIGVWVRAAAGWAALQGARFARFGDNMRDVAVTEGDKVEAQIKFGYSVHGFGLGDLVAHRNQVSDEAVGELLAEYGRCYDLAAGLQSGGAQRDSLATEARTELGLRSFLEAGNFQGFTTTFEDLHGLPQLPGLAVQRLMAAGYGFGAEGDWKVAALGYALKVMSQGLPGGASFMEDYTYHLAPGQMAVLGAHMLEIDESLAASRPRCEVHPLSIGGKADPVRLVFDVAPGPALNASLIDMGNRFRLLVNEVDAIALPEPLPRLPVARALWVPRPDLKTAAGAWILAGGAHHTVFTQALTAEYLADFAEMAGVEYVAIDADTRLPRFRQELRWSEVHYHLAQGF
ncbi:L-arabinose isomerase [Hymenobacter sp.]|uniref:L-arabinose isomerase n=1 Tax=Hymenobacter sp. TaxID=1898978 RepID=UPI00286C51C6|nr:L-arabinose isomerase [Hymenobacter sp.]